MVSFVPYIFHIFQKPTPDAVTFQYGMKVYPGTTGCLEHLAGEVLLSPVLAGGDEPFASSAAMRKCQVANAGF